MVTEYRELMAAAAQAAGLHPREVVTPEDRWVTLNGMKFHYLDWGNAHLPHVVLLHGGSLTAHTWDMAALLLRDRYHLVALDQRGHGDTDWTPEADLTRDQNDLMLEDTRLFMEHLGYERCVLVGMSMGGINSIRYAARHPERLQALCIVDIGPAPMQAGQVEMEQFREATETLASFDDFLNRAIQFMPHRAPEHLRYSLTHSLRPRDEGGWTWKQDHRGHGAQSNLSEEEQRAEWAKRAESLWADLRAIQLPTLLLRGDWSKILSDEHAREVVAAMHNARLAVVPRATHNVHSDNPADFAQELDGFLTSLGIAPA